MRVLLAACALFTFNCDATPSASSQWYALGTGRFSWGERWSLRVRRATDVPAQHCVNLVPAQPRQRSCPAGTPFPPSPEAELERHEHPCSGRAYVYGGVADGAHDVRIVSRRGAPLPARVRFLPTPPGLGIDARYFVAEVRTRERPAHQQARARLGRAIVQDASGRELARIELSDHDVVETTVCGRLIES